MVNKTTPSDCGAVFAGEQNCTELFAQTPRADAHYDGTQFSILLLFPLPQTPVTDVSYSPSSFNIRLRAAMITDANAHPTVSPHPKGKHAAHAK